LKRKFSASLHGVDHRADQAAPIRPRRSGRADQAAPEGVGAVHRRTECSVAARTETVEYPRSAGGRREACAVSLFAAFHAASNTPRASQLSDASRCCAHHVSEEPHRPAPPALYA
jgi:hypothetical protein